MSAVGATQPAGLGASDEALVAAVRRGDDHAFGELYSRYGSRIVAYVLGMVGDHGRAEDITQEVFISALRRMRATERPIAFKPWIYEIAKNACIDEFRRTRRTKEVPLGSDEDDGEREARIFVSGGPTPDTALERRQQLDDLKGAFRGLSDNHHKILVMRELEGLSYTEIGRRMGMTRTVVESTLFRARRRLGQEYEEIASGQRCEQVHAVIDAGGPRAVRALGVREHRRLARHVSHCQPCRRYAFAAGVDEGVLKRPTVVGKVAALLPIPAFLRFRRGGGEGDAAGASATHSAVASLQSATQTVEQFVGPGSPISGLGRVAAAVAAVAVAGGGVVAGVATQTNSTPPQHRVVSSAAASSARSSGSSGHQGGTSSSGQVSGQAAKAATASKAALAADSTNASKAVGTGGGATSSQPVSHSAAGPSDGSASPSANTASAKPSGSKSSLLGSVVSGVSNAGSKLPPLPKVTVPQLPSLDIGSLGAPVNSALSGAVGLVNGLLNHH